MSKNSYGDDDDAEPTALQIVLVVVVVLPCLALAMPPGRPCAYRLASPRLVRVVRRLSEHKATDTTICFLETVLTEKSAPAAS